jgi:hypothetical protein
MFRASSPISTTFTLVLSASLASLSLGCGDDTTGAGGGGQGGSSTTASSAGGSGQGGDASGGGGSGSGTGGDGAGGIGAFVPGTPIDAPDETWTWVDFPDSRCINDTPTGIGINKTTASGNVAIFLMGGNACFNSVSCQLTANTNGYGAGKFANEGVLDVPLFDRTDPNNPLRDYSFVFVPYCTGDVHAGNREGVQVGGTERNFHGFKNMRAFLQRIVPTFPNADTVVLAGVSAGGFGAAFNYVHTAEAFGDETNVVLVDDSGPPMSSEFITPCLQKHFSETWGLASTFPEGCADCDNSEGVFIEPYIQHVLSTYPTRSLAVISSDADSTIRSFWGFGLDNCSSLNGFPASYPAAQYRAGLEDMRDRIGSSSNRLRLYMPTSTKHVWIGDDITTVDAAGGKNLAEWLQEAIDGDASWANASAP